MLKNWSNWIVLFFIQFFGWKFLFKNEHFVMFWYKNVTLTYNHIVYYFSSKFNIPFGEILYVLFGVFLIYIIINLFNKKSYLKKISLLFKVLFYLQLVYNSLWGIVNYKNNFTFNYTNLKIEVKDLKVLYYNSLDKIKILRYELGADDKKAIDFIYNNDIYLKDIERNLKNLQNESWVNHFNIPKNLIVKESFFSSILNQFGVLGYYNPFTVESNVNKYNSDLKTPFTTSHEIAHQIGFATENEANFIAYYLGVNSEIKEVQYAANFKTTFSLLNAIYSQDSIFVKNEIENLPLGIKTDRDAEIKYYKQYEGKLNDLFSRLNNQFLKVNNQEGVVSYSKYITLVYLYNLEQNKKANQH